MSDHNINGGYGNKPIPTPPPQPQGCAVRTVEVHPMVQDAFDAVRALRSLAAGSPQDAAQLLLGLVGDGTGGRSVADELARVVVRVAEQAAAQLDPAAGNDVVYAARLAEIALTDIAGEHMAPAITELEDTAPTPARPVVAAGQGRLLVGAR
ncbi:hypothetical protein [Kitasatospora sp. NPDC090091]|uniref:hypothetical protein n=1 Tax=Kitasatospora sp. NPDC090091 TaxID=3364081 RepID=UPI0037FA19EE